MRKVIITVLSGILISSCASVNQFVVTPLGEEPASYSQRFIFSLPRTVFEVKTDYIKSVYIPGPYRKFAEKYLGTLQCINEEKTEWEICNVQVSEFSEPDPLQYYSVNLLKGLFRCDTYFSMVSNGLVIDPSGAVSANALVTPKENTEKTSLTDVTLKMNEIETIDTLYKTIITDSSFVKIPIVRKQKSAKTIEQKAEEAANLILKIRKRRLKLISGDYAVIPEGKALEISLKELDRAENECLALFTGKVYTEKFSRSFFIIPVGGNEKNVIMKFSKSKGWLPKESTEGQEVVMEINYAEGYPLTIDTKSNDKKNTLVYRIPSACVVKISGSDRLLYEGRVMIYQAGELTELPVNK
jgi:hypothetical protein